MAGAASLASTFVDPVRLVGPALLLAFGLVLAAAAVLLFRRARRGSRVGDVPHCPTCDYVLTGLDTEASGARCPECGAALDARPVPRGERRYDLFFALVGFPVLVMGLVFAEYYRRRRRVMPLVVAHTLMDVVVFVGYALVPDEWRDALLLS